MYTWTGQATKLQHALDEAAGTLAEKDTMINYVDEQVCLGMHLEQVCSRMRLEQGFRHVLAASSRAHVDEHVCAPCTT